MGKRILQVNFTFNVPRMDYERAVSPLADKFADVPGLIWKIWIMDEHKSEAGGIYFFDNETSMKTYLDGELANAVINHPALSDFSVKQFEVMDEITAITHGPVT